MKETPTPFYARCAKPDWVTPEWLYCTLDVFFSFELDAFASAENAKCDKYITEAQDALAINWKAIGAVWCNPPYGPPLAACVAKGIKMVKENGCTVVYLLPSKTETRWYQDHAPYGEIINLSPRVNFIGGVSGPTFASTLMILRPERVNNPGCPLRVTQCSLRERNSHCENISNLRRAIEELESLRTAETIACAGSPVEIEG